MYIAAVPIGRTMLTITRANFFTNVKLYKQFPSHDSRMLLLILF